MTTIATTKSSCQAPCLHNGSNPTNEGLQKLRQVGKEAPKRRLAGPALRAMNEAALGQSKHRRPDQPEVHEGQLSVVSQATRSTERTHNMLAGASLRLFNGFSTLYEYAAMLVRVLPVFNFFLVLLRE